MPDFDDITRIKINSLRAIRADGRAIEVYELVRVGWPQPKGDVYYAVLQVDEIASVAPAVSPIETRLIPDGSPNWFLPVGLGGSIGDEEVDLEFWDGDGEISDLLVTYGEGLKVEMYYWLPQAVYNGPSFDETGLLLPLWHGHLRQEDEAMADRVRLKAVQGFQSADSQAPDRAHYAECQAIFGGVFDNQAEIDEHDCPYNKHLGGAVGIVNPATGVAWTFCDRRDTASCTARGVDPLYHLSHRTVQSIVINNQTSGPRLYSTSQGNETNLKEPVRVVMGTRRIYDMKIMAYRRDLNVSNPDRGWFFGLYEACEGPVQSITQAVVSVENSSQSVIALHYNYRLGQKGQTPASTVTTHGYSGTAYISYNFGWVDPREVEPNEANANALIAGLNNIRVYSDADTYAETYTNNRVWQIARILTDKRWGFGLDYERLHIPSWIDAADWAAESVRFTDTFGTNWDHVRARSDVELIAKKIQQQIDDMCIAGRLSRPFLFDGKIHIMPLRALTANELAACPVFTDEGDDRNVVWEENEGVMRSTLAISRASALDLANRVECVYDDIANKYLEQPLRPVEDVDAQLAAGRVAGDRARKVNPKKYSLLGVVQKNHAMKLAWSLLDLGPLDQGGLANNCRIKFRIWFMDALELHPHKVIKFTSSRLTRYGFTYFRILPEGLRRLDNLHYEVEAQAYAETYMSTFETVIAPYTPPVEPPPPPPPCVLTFGTVTFADGMMSIPVPPC